MPFSRLTVTAQRKNGTELRVALMVGVLRAADESIEYLGVVLRDEVEPPLRNAAAK
jgi:hypothetical protein